MSRVFFTADTHFGHTGILGMCARPFSTIAEHDCALIDNWNSVVGHDDIVWHLGDFAYRASPKDVRRIFNSLNGTKHLILGNHDHKGETPRLPWASINQLTETVVDGQTLVLCHYALRSWRNMRRGAVQLFGHSHGRMPGTSQCVDVGVDVFDMTPATWPEIRARMATLPKLRIIDGDDSVPELDLPTDQNSVGLKV